MKTKLFKRTIASLSALAMVGTTLVVPLTADAQIVRTPIFDQDFEGDYTAAANTEVVVDPSNASNKVLKISNGASGIAFADAFKEDVCSLTMDVYFATKVSGFADKNYNGLYFAFAQGSSALGTALKVYGASTDTSVPVGFTFGGSGGQYGKAGDANIGKWYTMKVDVDKTSSSVGYTFYDKADFDANGSNASVAFSKLGMGYRNNQKPQSLIITMNSAADEYFYIDNIHSFTEVDTEAENELKAVSFKTTPGQTIIPPEGDKEEKSFPVELALTGTQGDLAENEVDSITWTHIGTEKDDGYIGWNFEDNKSAGSIVITNGVSTYFSVLTATVKKGDKEIAVNYRFMINAAGDADANQIYPPAGYPTDYNEYADSLVGYTVVNGLISDADPIMAKWASVGSNGSRTLTLKKDDNGNKYFEISNGGNASGSTVAGVTIGTPSSQVIFDFEGMLVNGSSYIFSNNTSNNSAGRESNYYRSGFEVSYNGSNINAGTTLGTGSASYSGADTSIENIESGKWYRFIVSYDITIQEYYVKVYDGDTLVGEIPAQKSQENASPSILSMAGTGTGIRNLRVYKPVIDSIDVRSASNTVRVPETDETEETLDLSAVMKTTEGLDATGNVSWSLADGEVAGVEINSTGSQTATLKVSKGAPSGEVKIIASKDSISKEYIVNLISSSNNVAFVQSVSNIMIPFDGEEAVEAVYAAETRTGTGEPITGDTITYRLLDSTKTSDANVKGVSFENGTLTVAAGASPAVVYVYAQNAEGLSNTVRVNIHGMTFGFGTGEKEEGYTQVTSQNIYNDNAGYGFASSVGLNDTENSVAGSDAYTFEAKVPNGNYVVKVSTTSGSMKSENASGSATGTSKSGSEFNVAVCDGVLDLTFDANSDITSLQISQMAKKTPGSKPAIYSIGDSTTKNNGHYSKYNEDKARQQSDPSIWVDEREYASWGNCVTEDMYSDTFASYYNHGMAGRNSASYYNQGRLEAVLLAIAPGDYVTINMGINSETNEPYESIMENYYVQGVIQRGAIPVILTHTPDGVGFGNSQSSYDEATGFHVSRADNGRVKFLKSLAEKYDLALIDVGQWGEDYFNSLTTDDLDKANKANAETVGYTAPMTVYELVRSWYPDHNHYTKELGSVIAEYIMDELTKIEKGEAPAETPTPTPMPTDEPVPTDAPTPTPMPTDEPVPTDAPTPTPAPTDAPAADPIVFDGDKTVTVTTNEKAAVLVHAKYKDGRLKAVDTTELADAALSEALTDGKAVITKTDISNGDKLMLWKSIASQQPIGEVLVVDNVEVNPDIDQEATDRLIWKAENVTYTAGQDLGNGLSLVFGEGDSAPYYAGCEVLDTETNKMVSAKKIIGGIEFEGYVTSKGQNGDWDSSIKTIPNTGVAAIKYSAAHDGVLTVYFDKVDLGKDVWVGRDGMTQTDIKSNSIYPGDGSALDVAFNVKAGEEYYIFIKGSRARFCGVGFEEGAHIDEPEPTEQPPAEISETEWAASEASKGVAEGTELMKGLTTLFTDTKNNAKYISNSADAVIEDGKVVSGNGLKYVASKNGTLTVGIYQLGKEKSVYANEEGFDKNAEPLAKFENTTSEKLDGSISFEVTAGTTYYIYGKGTKAGFSSATFTPAD